ncbi:38073_t:CDS:2, partial [Gigaspora margarita]
MEIEKLEENLNPETHEAKKALALKQDFGHFSEGIEANKEFNFYVSSEYMIMDLYQHLVNEHYICIKGNCQSGKTTSIIAIVNLLQEKSNTNELPVSDLE